jgi:hypothetical protein
MDTKDQSGTDQTTQSTGFSEDYVKSLRDEAASWRTKFRELEATNRTKDIEIGLAKRNIKALPSWVTITEGQSIDEALDAFANEFSHLVQSKEDTNSNTHENTSTKKPTKPFTPPTQKISNVETKDLNQILAARSLEDVKQDPKAREQLRDWYRSALRGTSK